MTVFDNIEHDQKSPVLPSIFLKFSPSPRLGANVFSLIHCPGRATAIPPSAFWPFLYFQHHHRTACWEIPRFFDREPSLTYILDIYYKSRATPTFHQNFALVVFFSGHNFQKMLWQIENFISSRVPRILRFRGAIFSILQATNQIR